LYQNPSLRQDYLLRGNKIYQAHKWELEYKKLVNIIKALHGKKFIYKNNKPVIEWKYILFRWNDNKLLTSNAIRLAKEAKIDRLSFWFTYSPIYGISWKTLLKSFSRKEHRQIKTINLATQKS
jgi:hypothetical protein